MPMMPVDVPTAVNNHDVVNLLDMVARYSYEVYKSVSSSVAHLNEFDRTRLLSYLDAIDFFHDHILAQKLLDIVESHPRNWELEPFPVVTDVENDVSNQILRLFSVIYEELSNSQSARMASSLISHDSARLRSYVDKVRKFVLDYADKVLPADLPETSPMESSSGVGFKGVNPK